MPTPAQPLDLAAIVKQWVEQQAPPADLEQAELRAVEVARVVREAVLAAAVAQCGQCGSSDASPLPCPWGDEHPGR